MTAALTLRRDRVYVEDAHPQSRAALLYLRAYFGELESDEWLRFRLEFLKSFETLTCHYCGKENLVIELECQQRCSSCSKRKRRCEELKTLATLDHVVPRAKGGAEYDPDNLVVACFPCNQEKADKYEGS